MATRSTYSHAVTKHANRNLEGRLGDFKSAPEVGIVAHGAALLVSIIHESVQRATEYDSEMLFQNTKKK